jgi:hypothetical protein
LISSYKELAEIKQSELWRESWNLLQCDQ